MRKIRDVLRLSAAGMSKRQIAVSLGVSATAAGECLRRARHAGVTWPLPEDLTDEALERRLYPPPAITAKDRRPRPDWAAVHRELRRAGVTLQLLWEEHRAAYPDGYGFSRFCELYRAWKARLSPTMRQSHVAGERLFVDYAGTTLPLVDASTGKLMSAQLFVAVLGASNYTYAEASWTQGLSDWIGAHTRTFAFIESRVGCSHSVSVRKRTMAGVLCSGTGHDRKAPSSRTFSDEAGRRTNGNGIGSKANGCLN